MDQSPIRGGDVENWNRQKRKIASAQKDIKTKNIFLNTIERSWDKFVGGLGYWTNLLRGRGSATLTRAHVRNHGNHPGGC